VQQVQVNIPAHAFDFLGIPQGHYKAKELIGGKILALEFAPNRLCSVTVQPYDGILLKIIY